MKQIYVIRKKKKKKFEKPYFDQKNLFSKGGSLTASAKRKKEIDSVQTESLFNLANRSKRKSNIGFISEISICIKSPT